MIGYFYFSDNLEDKRPHNRLYAKLPNKTWTYSTFSFVIEAVLVSEKIAQYRFGSLLETRDKFGCKLNAFSYMILQCSLNILENFITILYAFGKHNGLVVLIKLLGR